jgi:phosphoglucosamine mutase
VRYKGGRPLDTEKVIAAIAAAQARLGAGGRLVIRPSGTEPVIRVMAEADDRELVERLVDDVCDAVAAAAA